MDIPRLSQQEVTPQPDGWYYIPQLVGGYAFRCRHVEGKGWEMQGDRGYGWTYAPAEDTAWMLAARDAIDMCAAAAGLIVFDG